MKIAHIHIVASLLGFIAVACGAFGAHALKARLTPEDLEIWKTAVFYLLVHTPVTLFAARFASIKSCYCFLAGSIIFSGTLFVLVLSGVRWLGAITPIGGVLLLVGWLLLAFSQKPKLEA